MIKDLDLLANIFYVLFYYGLLGVKFMVLFYCIGLEVLGSKLPKEDECLFIFW